MLRDAICSGGHRWLTCALRSRRLSSCASSSKKKCTSDPRYVDVRHAPPEFDVASAVVYPGFVTEEEGNTLIKEAGKRLKRRRFEDGHWDAVITKYREVEMSIPNEQYLQQQNTPNNDISTGIQQYAEIIQDTRMHISNNHFSEEERSNKIIQWLPCHAIDLSADGGLFAHVDSVKFSGGIVAGISLLSDSIMRLRPSSEEWEESTLMKESTNHRDGNTAGYVDLYLPQLSLYVLSGMSRYSYTHELLPSGSSFEFPQYEESNEDVDMSARQKIDVIRGRRLSIIFRDGNRK